MEPKLSRSIMILVPRLGLGGAEQQAVDLANYFAANGLEAHLVVLRGSTTKYNTVHPKVKILDRILDEGKIKPVRIIRNILKAFSIARYARNHAIRSALCLLDEAVIFGGLVRIFSRSSISLIPLQVYLFGEERFSNYRMADHILQFAMRRSSDIIAVSSLVKENIELKMPDVVEKVRIINNFLDISRVQSAAQESSELTLPKDDFIIGMGRLHHEKRFDLLIRAFTLLKETLPSLQLLILGDGSERENLQKLATDLEVSDSVHLSGAVANPFPILARAKALVLCSESEGFGNVILEAMACSVPVVSASSVGAARDVLNDGQYGYVVSSQDPESFAHSIRCAISEGSKPASLNRVQEFDLRILIKDYLKVLQLQNNA